MTWISTEMKAYNIYIDGKCPAGLLGLRQGEAHGAMAFARQIYWNKHVEMIDQDSREVVEQIPPREVGPVDDSGSRKLLRALSEAETPGELSLEKDGSIKWQSFRAADVGYALHFFRPVLLRRPEYIIDGVVNNEGLYTFWIRRSARGWYPYPRVGVGVVIKRDDKVLLGKRTGSHGAGEWSLPGGHLEFYEELHECARREVREETGLEIEGDVTLGPYTNDFFFDDRKHYITLYLFASCLRGDPRVMEPNRCEEWRWCSSPYPEPIFLPLKNLLTRESL